MNYTVKCGQGSSVYNRLLVKCNSIDIVVLIYFKRLPFSEHKKSNNLLKTVHNIVIYLPIILYIKFNPFLYFFKKSIRSCGGAQGNRKAFFMRSDMIVCSLGTRSNRIFVHGLIWNITCPRGFV